MSGRNFMSCDSCQGSSISKRLNFPCNHRFCLPCYKKYIESEVEELKSLMKQNLILLQGQSKSFGCIYKCGESELIYAADYISSQTGCAVSKKDQQFLQQFYFYFNGVPSFFQKCKKCRKITAVCSVYQWKCVNCSRCAFCGSKNHTEPCEQHIMLSI